MSKDKKTPTNLEVTFIKETKLNSQRLLPGHIITLPYELAQVYIKQRRAIVGGKNKLTTYKNGKKITLDTEKVEGRDKLIAAKEMKKKGEDAKAIAKYMEKNAREAKPDHMAEGVNKSISTKALEEKNKAEHVNLAILDLDELKAIALEIGATPNSQAKEAGVIKAILKVQPNYKNEKED